nr:histidine kinase [Nonomuraea candida]
MCSVTFRECRRSPPTRQDRFRTGATGGTEPVETRTPAAVAYVETRAPIGRRGGRPAGSPAPSVGRVRRGWRAELARQAHAARLEREREAARRVEQERLRIARDLHDLMAHTVSVISLHPDVARESLRDAPEVAERSLAPCAARAATWAAC